MKNIIIKGIGPDKPGIVSRISGIITSNNGNIEESRMIRLGSEFSIIMMISIDDKHQSDLSKSLESIKVQSSVILIIISDENFLAA